MVDVGDPEPVDLGARVEVPREHDRVGRRRHHRQIGRHDLKMKYTQYELYGTGYMGRSFGLVENMKKIRDMTSLH